MDFPAVYAPIQPAQLPDALAIAFIQFLAHRKSARAATRTSPHSAAPELEAAGPPLPSAAAAGSPPEAPRLCGPGRVLRNRLVGSLIAPQNFRDLLQVVLAEEN